VIDGGSLRIPRLIQRPAPFQTIIALLFGSGPVEGGLISPEAPEKRSANAPRHHSRSKRTTPRGRFRRRAGSCRDLCQRRDRPAFLRGGLRDPRGGASALCSCQVSRHLFSEATAAAARRAGNPALHPGVASDFATRAVN